MVTRPDAAPSLVWSAQPKQQQFLIEYANVFELLFGGAAGGSKSETLLVYNILRRVKYPHSAGLYLRRTFPELAMEGGAIPRSHALLAGTGAVWNGSEHKWRFPNQSTMQFGHLQHPDSIYAYKSSAFQDLEFDEVTSLPTEAMYLYLWSRARSVIPGCEPRVRGATNPGGPGHHWVKRRFVDGRVPGSTHWYKRQGNKEVECDASDPQGRSRAFLQSVIYDNQILMDADPGYLAVLMALPEDDRRALLDGDWAAWAGAVFKAWSTPRHVVRPFIVPAWCRRVVGLDWGYARPFCAHWIASGHRLQSDPPGPPCSGDHQYVYREISEPGLLDEQMAAKVAKASHNERISAYHADPASFFQHHDRTGPIPEQIFRAKGVPLTPANNSRIPGKRAVDAALADCACGVPRLRVFETCTQLIQNLPALVYDRVQVEDVDTKGPDDEYDSVRYGLMGPRSDRREEPEEIEVVGRHAA